MPRLWQPDTADLELAEVLHALADPSRLAIVARIARFGPHNCVDLGGQLELHKSTLSHHYRVLREAGVTWTEVNGRSRRISLRRADLQSRFPGLLDAVLASMRDTFAGDAVPSDAKAAS
jgi:DNA-binding transcriptional ArsR family regulator